MNCNSKVQVFPCVRMRIGKKYLCCNARSRKKDRYFVENVTSDEFDLLVTEELENIIYAEYRRDYGVNVLTSLFYLVGWIYWYLIPDPVKYFIMRLVLHPIKMSVRSLQKCIFLFFAKSLMKLHPEEMTSSDLLCSWHATRAHFESPQQTQLWTYVARSLEEAVPYAQSIQVFVSRLLAKRRSRSTL